MTAATVAAGGPPRRATASLARNRRWALFASYAFLILFAIFFLTPPYYMVVTALKSDAEVAHMATNPWFVANGVTLDQFRILFTDTDFLLFFRNTAIVTVCVVVITMVVSVLAAFSLGRMKFWAQVCSRPGSSSPTWCPTRSCSSRCSRSCAASACSTPTGA